MVYSSTDNIATIIKTIIPVIDVNGIILNVHMIGVVLCAIRLLPQPQVLVYSSLRPEEAFRSSTNVLGKVVAVGVTVWLVGGVRACPLSRAVTVDF